MVKMFYYLSKYIYLFVVVFLMDLMDEIVI